MHEYIIICFPTGRHSWIMACPLLCCIAEIRNKKRAYESYFAEYCTRKKFIDSATDKCNVFLRLISLVYHTPLPPILPERNDHYKQSDGHIQIFLPTTSLINKTCD